MSLFVSHSSFGIGKIQKVGANRFEVLFYNSKDEQLRQFTFEAFGHSVRRCVLRSGTPCIVAHQRYTVDCLLRKGEGSHPHAYCLLGEDGEKAEILETCIELSTVVEVREDEASEEAIRPGLFVTANDRHGVGKVLAVHGGDGDIAFFHYPGKEDIRRYPLEQIERVVLSPETRVFYPQDDGWSVGRITDCLSGKTLRYTVKFPNKKEDDVLEDELYVPCMSAQHSPVDLMANRCMQTQFFYDSRMAFMKNMIELRNKCQGLSGVLSSSVELVAHQIRAVQQVLTDSVQRYVLADEVGLGKTIEAGYVIRQTLLDVPLCRVGVLAPPHLVEQWEQELQDKFRVSHFAQPPMVLPYHESDQLAGQELELLVVDEAHNIFSPQGIDETITRLCLGSRRLLLLTATPVVGHEQTFLNMLKVLDPDIFADLELADFRQKVERRQEFGALARMFGASVDVVPPLAIITASKLLASDDNALKLLADLREATEGAGRLQAKMALYHHIVENHRIFHRLIRNRRKDITDNSFLPRSFDPDTRNVMIIPDDNRGTLEHASLFEEWRQAAHDFLADSNDASDQSQMALDCARLFEAVGASTFGQELDRMVMLGRPGGRVKGADILAAAAIRPQSQLPPLAAMLAQAVDKVVAARKQSAPRHVGPVEIVVFLTDARLCSELESMFTPPPGVRVHFLTRQGEEGQNYQYAHAIVHMDVPLDPVRMEQRIGRLDRFNRTARSLLHVCCCPGELEADNPWFAWLNTLLRGYKIFNEPISDVQFLLENERVMLAEILLLRGVAGIDEYCNNLPCRLEKERNDLDEQYEFDKHTRTSDNEEDWLEALRDADENKDTMERNVNFFLSRALQIDSHTKKDCYSYEWRKNTLIPAIPWKEIFSPGLEVPSTFSRIKAVRDPSVSILRLGHPLVEALERFCRWDVRGLAFATWRTCRDLQLEEPWVGFKLDFVVEGDLREWENDIRCVEKLSTARRRADRFLPPWMETHFLDYHLSPVTDGMLLKHLSRPYNKNCSDRDFNLQKRLDVLETVIDREDLARLTHQVAESGEHLVRHGETFQEAIHICRAYAAADLDHRRDRLQRRKLSIATHTTQMDSLRQEQDFEQKVAQAVMDPAIRLESIGLFVLAPYAPGITSE